MRWRWLRIARRSYISALGPIPWLLRLIQLFVAFWYSEPSTNDINKLAATSAKFDGHQHLLRWMCFGKCLNTLSSIKSAVCAATNKADDSPRTGRQSRSSAFWLLGRLRLQPTWWWPWNFRFSRSPPHKGHQSGGRNYWIRTGSRDWSEIGALGPFGRMRNANWVILRFWSQKCTHFFS